MRDEKGFTLIELLAVIVIIAIIATIGVYAVTKIIDQARVNALTDTAMGVRKAANLYATTNDLPLGETELNITPGTEDAGLVDIGKDPWGKPYTGIYAIINKTDSQTITVDIKFVLSNGEIWFLSDKSDQLTHGYSIDSVAPITGNAKVGNYISAGAVSPANATFSYQWQEATSSNGAYNDIAGATQSTYLVDGASLGKYIRLKVIGENFYLGEKISDPTTAVSVGVDVLVVAGGGGGTSGGGGAGGVIYQSNFSVTDKNTNVTVGAGGQSGYTYNPPTADATKGGNSIFGSLTAIGGGAGGGVNNSGLTTGGSGGGGGYSMAAMPGASGTTGQGFAGGNGYARPAQPYVTGGGGGASASGSNATSTLSGSGGNGYTSSITGLPIIYGGGGGGGNGSGYAAGLGGSGGGGNGSNSGNGAAGVNGLGGGGGGGRSWSTTLIRGGNGGTGVVIIRYLTGTITATGGTITTSGAYTVHTFNSSGTFTIQ